MASIIVRHKVADYAAWKRVYDEFEWFRKAGGITAASVHRDADEPNTFVVVHQFKDVNAAREFVESDDLRAAMARAGVQGPPEIWLVEDIERVVYS
jgi:quinol monooxygenase YgiN